jgi:AraC family transcriptional regulator of adaptative response / DNA-3-methyladenine glycosylase II
MDRAVLYQALLSRDKRFDGRFYVGVRTTGIYCRPVCPARPLLKNVQFYRSAAEAETEGFRPCLRCRPDLSPSVPLFQGTGAIVQRALRLIFEGAADAESLPRLADRLGITDRHLRRLFTEHVGAAPVDVAASKRLHLARLLLSQTRLRVTEIAFAAGFQSIRRFNQAFRDRYGRAPRDFRRNADVRGDGLVVELAVLEPYDWDAQLAFLARHATPGVERVADGAYERLLPGGGYVRVSRAKGALRVALDGIDTNRLRDALERVRHLFDVDHNPAMIAAPARGLRVPGAFDGFETAVTIVLGQLVSVAGARGTAGKLVAKFGAKPGVVGELTHTFPTPASLAEADFAGIGLTKAKAGAIRALARAVLAGEIELSRAAPLEATRAKLLALPGFGPWTTEMIALRCLGDTDAFPAKDLVVARALQSRRVQPDGWRPWRGYLTLWLWKNSNQKEKT